VGIFLAWKRNSQPVFLLLSSLLGSFIFWFIQAPDPRFIWGVFMVSTACIVYLFTPHLLCEKLRLPLVKNSLFVIIFFLFCFYHRVFLGDVIKSTDMLFSPNPLATTGFTTTRTNFEYNKTTEPCGNIPLPCSRRTSDPDGTLLLIGDGLQSGFKISSH